MPGARLQGKDVVERRFDILEGGHVAVAESLDAIPAIGGNEACALCEMRLLHLVHLLVAEFVGEAGRNL